MRYYNTLKVFKSKKCTFDPYKMEAWSYDWWQFVIGIRGTVYFNNVSYSMQTRKQQNIIQTILKDLNINYKTIYVKCGLQNIEMEIKNYQFEITQLELAIANPKSRTKTNKYRLKRIKHIESAILRLQKLNKLKKESNNEYIWSYGMENKLKEIVKKQNIKVKKNECKKSIKVVNGSFNTIESINHQPTLTCVSGDKLISSISKAKLTLVKLNN